MIRSVPSVLGKFSLYELFSSRLSQTIMVVSFDMINEFFVDFV